MLPLLQGEMEVVAFTKITRKSTEDTVRSFIEENNLGFPNAKEKGSDVSQLFNVSSIPAGAVVKDGVIVWRGNPAGLKAEDFRAIIKG